MNLSEEEQSHASEWLGAFETEENINIYFYQGETNLPWFLHAMSTANYKYVNTDQMPEITKLMIGYILGKTNTYYSTTDANISSLFGYINNCQVKNVTEFLERVLSAKTTS